MSLNEWVFWIGTFVVVTDAAIAWTHIVLYSTKSKWQLYDEGKALMATIGSYALTLTYVAVANLQGVLHGVPASTLRDYPQRGVVRILIFTIALFVLGRWLVLLIRNQRRSNTEVR
jgi:hypothetical protein